MIDAHRLTRKEVTTRLRKLDEPSEKVAIPSMGRMKSFAQFLRLSAEPVSGADCVTKFGRDVSSSSYFSLEKTAVLSR